MSKSLLYAGNSATQVTTVSGTAITFPTIIRRYGCNCKVNNGTIVASGAGYYEGISNITMEGTAAGTATVQVLSNGVAIPFASASVVTTDGSIDNISIPFVVRNKCNCVDSTISVVVSGVAVNVNNASITLTKE